MRFRNGTQIANRTGPSPSVSVFGVMIWFAGGGVALGQNAKLEFAEKPIMVDCSLANGPCFRLKFNIVDQKGTPVPVQLPTPGQLAQSLTIHIGDRSTNPFFASADSDGQRGNIQPRVALILIDVSGSMNTRLKSGQTRFEAAKAGALIFLNGFEDGTDRLAVAPFGSKHVEETIRSARFADTKEGARGEILALPIPGPKTNTALYSAVNVALDVLAGAARDVSGSPETLLLVMTDGENDVRPGDDAGLLAGDQGLETVVRKVQDSGIPVHAIGFGNKKEIDETALRRIGTKYYMTEDPEDLKRQFTVARTLLNSRMRVTLESPWKDRASLAGRSFPFTAELRLPNEEVLRSGETLWSTPQMGVPAFQGKCDEMEARALLIRPKTPDTTGWLGMALLRPLLVFLGFSVLLLALWFGLPRLIWPARYEQQAAALKPDRWVADTRVDPGAYGRKPPPGFDKRNQGAPERAPSDKTIIRPRDDFRTTRTRLE